MKKKSVIVWLAIALSLVITAGAAHAASAMRVADAIWAHDELYDTVLTDTTFESPPLHSTDIIYNFSMSGLEGQRSVAEAAPGDPDYNGGRWNVYMVTFTDTGLTVHDPDGDGIVNFELTSAEAVLEHEDLGHIVLNPANFYFECPMIPNRGRN